MKEYIIYLRIQLTYRFLYSVDSHNRYVCVYARTVENLQNVNVFSSGYESGDASCFVASVTQTEYCYLESILKKSFYYYFKIFYILIIYL